MDRSPENLFWYDKKKAEPGGNIWDFMHPKVIAHNRWKKFTRLVSSDRQAHETTAGQLAKR
jgi:hypothetical protein